MTIGSVYFEKHINPNLAQSHLDWLIDQQVAHLEFTVHDQLFDTTVLGKIINETRKAGLKVSYHSPDFVDQQHFSLAGLSLPRFQKQTLDYFERLLQHADQHATAFVIHGLGNQAFLNEKGYMPTDDQLASFNFKALDQLLNWISQYNLPLRLCFENTAPQDGHGFGQVPSELFKLHERFSSEHFGFCIDLSHLWRSAKHFGYSAEAFMDDAHRHAMQIEQFHLHGFSADLKTAHGALKTTDKVFISFVKAIHSKKLKKTFVFECFYNNIAKNLSEYETLLLQDIELF